jgi:glycosyltransferase involved in cell wall biosynthesis
MFQSPIPRVSIIVPCRNEARSIRECLRGVLAQQTSERFEVLIADGASNDGTRDIVQQLAASDSRVRLIDNPEKTTPTGLNAAIRAARGEIIIRIDAHTEYAVDYVQKCIEALERSGADNVGGPAATRADGYMQRAVAAAFHSPFSTGGAPFHIVDYEGEVDTVVYGCWRKETLLRIGLFDTELVRNQDDELNLRLRRQGGRLWQTPQIKSWYRPRSSLVNLFQQYQQYGYWKVRVIQKHKSPSSPRHLVPALFVIVLALGWLGAFWHWSLGLAYVGFLATYLLASLAMSWRAAITYGRDLLCILPVVFITFHLGYGIGFLRGLVDFVLLQKRAAGSMAALTRSG